MYNFPTASLNHPTIILRSVTSVKGGGSESTSNHGFEDGGNGDEATYLELMKKAIRQRQKQQKLTLLLGPNVPPLPPRRMLT